MLTACLPIEKDAATRYAYSSSTSDTLIAEIGAVSLEVASTSLVRNVVSVGAVCTRSDVIRPYSSEGPTLDGRLGVTVAAPGSISQPCSRSDQ